MRSQPLEGAGGEDHGLRLQRHGTGSRGSAGARSDDDDDATSIRTIVPHELERVEEEDEDQIARQEQQWDQQEEDEDQEERRRRGVELGRPRMPEPMGLGMTHLPLEDDEDPTGSQVL